MAGWTNIRLFSKLTANVWKYLEVSWVGLPWGPFVFGNRLPEGPSLFFVRLSKMKCLSRDGRREPKSVSCHQLRWCEQESR